MLIQTPKKPRFGGPVLPWGKDTNKEKFPCPQCELIIFHSQSHKLVKWAGASWGPWSCGPELAPGWAGTKPAHSDLSVPCIRRIRGKYISAAMVEWGFRSIETRTSLHFYAHFSFCRPPIRLLLLTSRTQRPKQSQKWVRTSTAAHRAKKRKAGEKIPLPWRDALARAGFAGSWRRCHGRGGGSLAGGGNARRDGTGVTAGRCGGGR
jgi:hypothetical protein